jgi:hypothetical protein
MAEKRQIGIPDEPLDYTSDFITKPYDLDDTKGYEDEKHEVLSGELKRTVVGENWKIPSQPQERRPQVVQALEGLERGIGDINKGFLPQEQIKWRTDPVGAAAGWVAALSAPVLVGGAALLEGAESMFPETFGTLKPKESKELTREKLEQVWEDTLQKESQKLEQARTDLESGKISQVQYDAMEKQFDTLVGRRQKAFENIDKYNATVQALDGTPYPNAKVADTVVSESARYLQMRELNNAIEMAQKGIDPESTGFKIGSLAGPTAVLGAIGFGGNYLSRYGLSGALRRITTDVETEGGAARLAAIKPVRSRRQAARAGMAAVEVGTEEMESAQYVWQNVQDYIERTGDKTLENFTPQDAKAFSASAYGAIAGKIETMGGIENIAAGAFRRLGVGGFGRRVLATGGEEALEEGAQKLTEYLSRRIDGTTDKTIGEALEEALNSAAWGGFMGIGFGTIGGVTYRNARKQGIKVLQDYGLSRETAEKVFDNMIEQTTDAISPRNEPVRENIRKKVALIYENADLSPAELEDTIEATTDLEMAMIAYDSANRGIDIADHPLLNSTVNNIGWFRDGIPEQIADQVAALDEEIGNLRRQLAEENAKEKPDMDKIDDLEAKIEQFFAKLPKEVSDLVETDRQKVRQMLGEQSAELQARQAQRRIVQQVQKRATSALQREQESDVKKSLRRLEQETKTEEKKAKETERQQRTQQRKLRKAIEKLRQNMTKRKNNLPLSQELFADADLVYQALRDSGFSDQQIATMAEEDIVKAVAPYGISPVVKQMTEQFDLADENARLDDIYPEYTGETIVVDGKERTVYNSEGKRINKSAEALTNFWRWFGDSKVVDSQGRPLVVYHGTSSKFDSFNKSRTGIFFNTTKKLSELYGTELYSVYLKIENPFIVPKKEFELNGIKLQPNAFDTINIQAEKMGYDGVINKDVYDSPLPQMGSFLGDNYAVFDSTQIKSVDNRGTYSPDTGNIYYQTQETEPTDKKELVVSHGISLNSLEKSLDLGGLPMPSIAITKATAPLTDFGSISLIGTKNMIDPSNPANKVYDRDIWSITFPTKTYKNAKRADISKFNDKFRDAFKKADDLSRLDGSVLYYAGQSSRPEEAVDSFVYSDGAKLYYIENVLGEKFDVPTYDKAKKILDNSMIFVKADEQFIEEISKIDLNKIDRTDDLDAVIMQPIQDLLNRFDFDSEYGDKAKVYEEHARQYYSGDKFNFQNKYHLVQNIKEYVRSKGEYEVDKLELSKLLDAKIKDSADYERWATKQVEDLLGEPKVAVGKKLEDWTLENIAKSMIKNAGVNAQKSLVYGSGKVIASGAKKLSSIQEIKEIGKNLKSKEDASQDIEKIQDAMDNYTSQFMTSNDITYSLNQKEEAYMALGRAASAKKPTKETIQSALNYEFGKKDVYDDKILEEGLEIVKAIQNLSRHYFEAKPQRIVRIEEFVGAVVPTDSVYDNVATKLSERGLKVVRTDNLQNGILDLEQSVGNVLFQGKKANGLEPQTRVSGKGGDFRGFFVPEYRLVVLTQQADPTTAAHEFAHDWMQQFFRYYRSGQANESFMKSWGAVEKALGITEDDITVPEKASEAFARAFEAWVENKEDWTKGLDIDDDNRDKIVETFKRYQGYLTDIYEDLNNPYFRDTWGETGKLKPELQAWFDKVVIPSDLISAQVATGAITPQEAETKIITRNVNQVVQAAEDNFTQKEKDEINAVERLNDTKRYEVEGGNKNSLQNRLSGLARNIDANNIALGRYDTHRDMLAVAQAADEFVRTRRDEALNIINGLEPEKEGLYASDLYTALERVAMETNDVDLAMDLVNSKVAKDLAKEWGQRVAGFRNFTGDGEFDAISQIKSLDNKYKKDYDEKGKERVKSASDEFVKELDKTDSDQDLDSFFDSVKCQ